MLVRVEVWLRRLVVHIVGVARPLRGNLAPRLLLGLGLLAVGGILGAGALELLLTGCVADGGWRRDVLDVGVLPALAVVRPRGIEEGGPRDVLGVVVHRVVACLTVDDVSRISARIRTAKNK